MGFPYHIGSVSLYFSGNSIQTQTQSLILSNLLLHLYLYMRLVSIRSLFAGSSFTHHFHANRLWKCCAYAFAPPYPFGRWRRRRRFGCLQGKCARGAVKCGMPVARLGGWWLGPSRARDSLLADDKSASLQLCVINKDYMNTKYMQHFVLLFFMHFW